MDKIKNALHGGRKSEDVGRDSQPSSSTAEGQRHPIYDEMTGSKEGRNDVPLNKPAYEVKTTSGEPYTVLAKNPDNLPAGATHPNTTSTSEDRHQSTNQTHAKDGGNASIVPLKVQEKLPESVERAVPNAIHDTGDRKHDNTDTTTHSGSALRPHNHNTEISSASIKSGVIGFGPNETQGHAALSTHNPTEQYMSHNQVLGGGHPGTAGQTQGQGVQTDLGAQSSTQPNVTGQERSGNLGAIKEQPYEHNLRQESYTADTDRSFPLAGGVASRHPDEQTSTTQQPGQYTSTTRHPDEGISGTRHPVDVAATQHSTQHEPITSHKAINEREPGTKEREAGLRDDSRGREGLAGAAAAATAIGASQAVPRSEHRDTRDEYSSSTAPETTHAKSTEDEGLLAKGKRLVGLGSSKDVDTSKKHPEHIESRQAGYGDVPQTTAPTAGASGNTTHNYHPEALAAATAAAAKSQEHDHDAQNRGVTGTQTTNTSNPVTGFASNERPNTLRQESHHRHIPGEFIATPSERAGTFLDYHNVVEPTSTGAPTGQLSHVGPTSTLDSSTAPRSGVEPASTTGQHELRHTGTLDEPRPRASEEHHYGRDAAIAGGIGAGVAGLGAHEASRRAHTPEQDSSKPLYESSSPYSSKALDPRALSDKQRLEEQRFDPQAGAEVSPHHAAQTSNPTGFSSATGPSASHGPTKAEDPQHHYGRDAALVGAGAATAGGLHHTAQRNDTSASGPAGLSQDSSYTSPSSTSAPYQQSLGRGNDAFYGTSGAPAPVSAKTAQYEQPQSNLGHTNTPGSSALPERESQHHYGRDAALAGAGAATAGGLYAASRDNETGSGPASNTVGPHSSNAANIVDPRAQPDPNQQIHHNVGSTSEDPASKTVGPHKSNIANILDPRVKPDPSKQKEHTTTGPHQSDSLNRLDPKVDEKAAQQGEHHYGRDAAIGGAGGVGAYEAAKAYGDHRMTGPGASMNEQRYDPTTSGANAPSPVPATSQYDYNDPNTHSHVNRNVAAGTGAGLATAGAYEAAKHHDNTQRAPLQHQTQDFASSAGPTQSSYPTQGTANYSYPTQGAAQSSYPTQGSTQTAYPTGTAPYDTHAHGLTGHRTQDPVQTRTEPDHDKRNAALLGAGGVGAAGAAYAYSHEQDERERARLEKEQQERLKKEAHDREKEQHKLDKEQHKHDKEVQKHEKAVAAHEKEEHRLQKEHDKQVAAEEKEQHRREKEAEKEARRHSKEIEGEEKEKKGGLFGFLHRDKSKKEKTTASGESSPRQSKDYSPRHSKEYAAGALGAATTAAAYDETEDPNSPRWKGKNLLHKDPPKGHPARDALEQGELHGGKREHIGVDGPIGDPNVISGDRETSKGVYGAHSIDDNLSHGTTGRNVPVTEGYAGQNVTNPEHHTARHTGEAATAAYAGHELAGHRTGHETTPGYTGRETTPGYTGQNVTNPEHHTARHTGEAATAAYAGHELAGHRTGHENTPGYTGHESTSGYTGQNVTNPEHHTARHTGEAATAAYAGHEISKGHAGHEGLTGQRGQEGLTGHSGHETGHSGTVIEPHTGLPMNVGKYGTGVGGTDGNATIHGQHTHEGQTGAAGNLDAIKKADTPY